jgi:hypothetical protein
MNLKHMVSTTILASALVSLVLTGCSNPASASAPPEQVVEEFYGWHLGYPGNALVDRAYRSSDHLAPSYIEEVDALLDSFDKGGFDPFLLAQDLPEEITVEDAIIEDEIATVLTHQKYGGNPVLRDLIVELASTDDGWKITGVRLPDTGPELFTVPAEGGLDLANQLGVEPNEMGVEPSGEGYLVTLTPRGVVQAFYSWYLGYIGQTGLDTMRNPLVDRAYRSNQYLTETFVREVDDLLDGFSTGGFDPFLLAQDIPAITVGEALVSGDSATVVTYQHYAGNPNVREVQVELVLVDGFWKISGMVLPEVACGQSQMSPAQVVESFFDWYLAYIGDPATGSFRNPMVDGAYRGHVLLTERIVQDIDELLDSFDGAGYDPFLCAQDIPQRMTAEERELDGGTAMVEVTTSFVGHSFRVDLVNQDGSWKIDDIRCAFEFAQ